MADIIYSVFGRQIIDKNLRDIVDNLTNRMNNNYEYKGNCDASKSINDYNTDDDLGIWRIASGSTVTDLPINRTANETIILLVDKARDGGNATLQTLIYTKQNIILKRVYNTESSAWLAWNREVVSSTTNKTGGKFVQFNANSSQIIESGYGSNSFLKASPTVNSEGNFKKLTTDELSVDELSVDEFQINYTSDSSSDFSTYYGCYNTNNVDANRDKYDKVIYDVNHRNPYLLNNCAFDNNSVIVKEDGYISLPDYSKANPIDTTYFAMAMICYIPYDVNTQDIISLFDGKLVVQKRGANGLRLVITEGPNGTSLATSDFITIDSNTQYYGIAIIGNTASANVTLTVSKISDLKNKILTTSSVDTSSSTKSIYIPSTTDVGKILANGCRLYASTEAFSTSAINFEGTATDLINNLLNTISINPEQVATVNQVNKSVQDIYASMNAPFSKTITRIGTWLNGTPVWRYTFQGTWDNFNITSNVINDNVADGYLPFAYTNICEYFIQYDAGDVWSIGGICYIQNSSQPCIVDDLVCPYCPDSFSCFTWPDRITTSNYTQYYGMYGYIDFITPYDNIKWDILNEPESVDPEPAVLGVDVDSNGNMTVTGKTVTPNIDSSGNLTFTGISSVNVDSNGDMTFVE